jgi:hypothetical protein
MVLRTHVGHTERPSLAVQTTPIDPTPRSLEAVRMVITPPHAGFVGTMNQTL